MAVEPMESKSKPIDRFIDAFCKNYIIVLIDVLNIREIGVNRNRYLKIRI